MIPYISTAKMSREDWLKQRREGIGGSEAAAVLGVSPWSSPLSVYMDKLGLSEEKEPTEAMKQGTAMEQIVADRFAEETGKKIQRCFKMFRHPEHDFMQANIDRQVMGEDGFVGLECKTTSPFNKTDFEDGEVPPTYYWQCQHYMAVTGAKNWYLAVMVLSQSFHVFRIERDETAIGSLIAAEETFWNENVLKKQPPLPTGIEDDEKAVKILTAKADDTAPEADMTQIKADLEERELLAAQIKQAETRKDELEQRIKMHLGEATKGSCLGFYATYKPSDSTRVDSKRLKADQPEIYAAYSKTTSSRKLLIKRVEVSTGV